MTVDVDELQEFVEKVKLETRMTQAAIMIQKAYRNYMFRRLINYKDKCARKL